MADWVLADQHPPSYGNFTDCCSDSSYFIPTLTAPHLADQVLADLPPSSMAISQIPALLWKLIFGRPSVGRSTPHHMAISQIAAQTTHISVLLWKLHIWQTRSWQIYPPHQWQFYRFLLYSESSYLADQVLADLTPHINGNFTDSCSTLRAQYLADQVSRSLADSCSSLKAHNWQTKCWQIYPLSNGNFTDCCSDSSYFIPTLRAHHQHLADQVRCNPTSDGNFTDSCSDSSYFIPTLRLIIWQTRSWQFYPHPMVISQISGEIPISFLLWSYHLADHDRSTPITTIFIFGRPSGGRSNPPIKWQAHRLLCDSESSTFGRPVLGRCNPPVRWHISQIPVKFIFHSYSKNWTFGLYLADHKIDIIVTVYRISWQICRTEWQFHRFPPIIPTLAISTDSCEIHISFLLWELNIWLRSGRSTPHQMAISQISALTVHISFLLWQLHIWQTRSWQMYPHLSGNFTDSYSDNSYFILTLRAHHLVDQMLADLPPVKWQFHRFLLWQLTFHDSSYFIPTLRAQHLADQVLADDNSYLPPFGRPGLGNFQ